MLITIINTIILIFSILIINNNFHYVKNKNNKLEFRIKRYILTGILVLVFGSIIVALSLIGARKIEFNFQVGTLLLITSIFIAISTYILILYIWFKMFDFFGINNSKKSLFYKLKSISIYGLVYSFGILFYLIYTFSLFKK